MPPLRVSSVLSVSRCGERNFFMPVFCYRKNSAAPIRKLFFGAIKYLLHGKGVWYNQVIMELLKKIKSEQGKNIWICGGAYLAQQLIREDLLDQYYISVIPVILGGGVRLFEETKKEIKLKLQKTQSYNGITDLIYTRR